jgi:hypothetical protein
VTTLNLIANVAASCGCTPDMEIGEIDVGLGTINVSGSGNSGIVVIGFVTAATLNASAYNVSAGPEDPGFSMSGATAPISMLGSNASDILSGSAGADVINGGPGRDIIINTNGLDPVTSLDTLSGGSGDDLFLLINSTPSAPILAAYGNAPVVTDYVSSPVVKEGDIFFLAPLSSAYGVADLQAMFGSPGEIPFQMIGNTGTAAAIDPTNQIVKLTQGTGTSGRTLQEFFDAAIGTATITDATASGAYFVTMYDTTNSRMAIGIVDATNGTDTVIEAGDTVILVGTALMSIAEYGMITTNQFTFEPPF